MGIGFCPLTKVVLDSLAKRIYASSDEGRKWKAHGLPFSLPYGGHDPTTIPGYWTLFSNECAFSASTALADGRIGLLGLSFHDKVEVFQEIVDATDLWTFCQIQHSFMDVEYQAGTKGLRYAARKGLAVVIMAPLRGGMLTQHIPPSTQQIWDSASVRRTPADFALQWVWNQPEISAVLSCMSTMDQVVENVESAAHSGPGTMSEDELTIIARVREQYEALCVIPCTACGYCLPCPSGVNIPEIFDL